MKNIVLIGMPASGKSTVGVILAKTLGIGFVDTDLVIQQRENALLQDIINEKGFNVFLIKKETQYCRLSVKIVLLRPAEALFFAMKLCKSLSVIP